MEAEPYYIDDDGAKRDDGLHDAMLENNPQADAAFAREAIRLAIESGLSDEQAKALYESGGD